MMHHEEIAALPVLLAGGFAGAVYVIRETWATLKRIIGR